MKFIEIKQEEATYHILINKICYLQSPTFYKEKWCFWTMFGNGDDTRWVYDTKEKAEIDYNRLLKTLEIE
jgi:hypothetical protein